MNLRDLLNSLARRWYVVVAGLLLTAGAGVALYSVIPVSYTSQASVVLLPPKSASDPDANPYLRLGGLSQAVDILTRSINSDAYREPLVKRNRGATFTTSADTTTSGPIILIESRAPTPARATLMTEAVLAAVPEVLDQIQSNLSVKVDSKIDVTTIAVDQKPKLDGKARLQVVVGVGALGVVLSVLLTGLIDGLAISRRRRRAEQSAAEDAASDTASAASYSRSSVTASASTRPTLPQGAAVGKRQSKGRQAARVHRTRVSTPSED